MRQNLWAIVDAITGTLVLFDGRAPVYWLRRIAQDDANDHGLTWSGPEADTRIVRVQIHEAKRDKKARAA